MIQITTILFKELSKIANNLLLRCSVGSKCMNMYSLLCMYVCIMVHAVCNVVSMEMQATAPCSKLVPLNEHAPTSVQCLN
jgi:hypothetical protein